MRAATACLAGVLALAGTPAAAVDAIVATETKLLVRFDTDNPPIVTFGSITGIGAGDAIVGMDMRPATRTVVLVTRDGSGAGRLYRLNPDTRVAVLVVSLAADPTDVTSPYAGLTGLRYGVDFDAVPDRLRLVSETQQNLSVNPDTGLVITDNDFNPVQISATASAYTNSFAGATTTKLWAIQGDLLYYEDPPNSGTMYPFTVLNLGGHPNALATLDIGDAPARNTAFMVLGGTGGGAFVFSVNLASGATTELGQLLGLPPLAGFTILDPGIVFRDGLEGP